MNISSSSDWLILLTPSTFKKHSESCTGFNTPTCSTDVKHLSEKMWPTQKIPENGQIWETAWVKEEWMTARRGMKYILLYYVVCESVHNHCSRSAFMVGMEHPESRRFGEESWEGMKQKSILLRVNKMTPTEFNRLWIKQFSKTKDDILVLEIRL